MQVTARSAEAANYTAPEAPKAGRMRLRYGLNIGDRWRDLACGPARENLVGRIRDAGTAMVRVFLDPAGRAPVEQWQDCAALFEAVLQTGAVPMIALACPDPRDPAMAQRFRADCCDLVDRAVDVWGSEAVASWFWSIGDEPNSSSSNRPLSFEASRDIYETVAEALRHRIGSRERRPRIGGPCADGFDPFWFDWIWRFLEEVDDSLIGFVAWNRYGEWRQPGALSAPSDPRVFENLLLSRTSEYWSRAEAVRLLVEGRGILNMCSELNAHSDTDPAISGRFNQGPFGAVYYSAALIDLVRGGADGEFLWAGACVTGPYGALNDAGDTTPVYEAKRAIARGLRFGDRISFPLDADPEPELDAVMAYHAAGPRAAVLVHGGPGGRRIELSRWPELIGFSQAAIICGRNSAHCTVTDALTFEGYGVALLYNREGL